MTNDDIDLVLTRRLRDGTAEKRLPPDFSDRLVKAVRYRRRMFRAKVIAVIAVAAVLGGVLGHFTIKKPTHPTGAALVAADTPSKSSEVSCWMLFGMLRECFKRNRTHKRKEEEQ